MDVGSEPLAILAKYYIHSVHTTVESERVYPPGGIVFLASLLSGGVLSKNGGNPLVEMTGTALKKSGKCQLMIDDASFMRLAAGGVISVPILVLSS